MICQWFGVKTTGMVSLSLASKPVATVSRFGPQNQQLRFGDLGLKITETFSWFGPQNQAGIGLSVAPQNQWRKVDMGNASKFGGLLHLEASHARVSQSVLKTSGGAMTGGTSGITVEVASR
jgi:hypothetical protein